MGRNSYSDRLTVEECTAVSMKRFKDCGYLRGGGRYGRMKWERYGRTIKSLDFKVSMKYKGAESIRFMYTITDRITSQKKDFDYKVLLDWTPCYFGGRRWWFLCPLAGKDGWPCNNRVGSLYLADGGYLGCRHCFNLTYQSCKDSHRFDLIYKKVNLNFNS